MSWICLHHVLNDLREVTQVELVVELLGSGHELRRVRQLSECDGGGVDDTLGQSLTLSIKSAKMRVKDLIIDCCEDIFLSSQAGKEGQVTGQTRIHVERTRLGVHASCEHDISQVFLLFKVISIIDNTVIDDLSKETNG